MKFKTNKSSLFTTLNWGQLLKKNLLEVLFVFIAFGLLVLLGSISIGSIIRKSALSTVSIALSESDKTIQAYLREPRIAFSNIYTAVQDLLDRQESHATIKQFLSHTNTMLSSQEEGITGFLTVYGLIHGEFISDHQYLLNEEFIPQREPWYQIAIRSPKAEFTVPYVDPKTGLTIISLAQEIYGKDGAYHGVLSMNIDISWLMHFVQTLRFNKGSYGMVLNQFMYLLAHPQEEYRYLPLYKLGNDYEKIEQLLRTNQSVAGKIIHDTNEMKVIVFFQQTSNGWFIAVVIPVSSYYADLYTTVLLLLTLGIILSCILCYILLRLAKDKMQADVASQHKSSFLTWISHEMRTPLNSIIGLVQIQMQKQHLSPDYYDTFKRISISGNSLLRIINDVLDLSKIETGKLELHQAEYSVAELINDTVLLNKINIKNKPLKFILELEENLPARLFGDELRFKQILNNLISNAIKYTNVGFVKLSIKVIEPNFYPTGKKNTLPNTNTNNNHLSTYKNKIKLHIIVEDTGQGLKQEDVKNLFSAYLRFNTDQNWSIEGTGIGLKITKNIVELMNGSIKVESKYNQGSIFDVILEQQLIDNETLGIDIVNSLKDFTFQKNKQNTENNFHPDKMSYGKVLIVDDLESNLYVARGLLQVYDLQIDTLQSGAETIQKIKEGKVYDIIFMDHMMPDLDGIETTQMLRKQGYDGIIVVLTANAIAGNEKMFKENGFNDFISKPIDTKRLDEILHLYIHLPNNNLHTSPIINPSIKKTPIQEDLVIKHNLEPELLAFFCSDLEKSIKMLKTSLVDMDLQIFTTYAHAMKTALRMIGEDEQSSKGAKLENAGVNQDIDYIKENTNSFIDYLEKLLSVLTTQQSQ